MGDTASQHRGPPMIKPTWGPGISPRQTFEILDAKSCLIVCLELQCQRKMVTSRAIIGGIAPVKLLQCITRPGAPEVYAYIGCVEPRKLGPTACRELARL